MSIFNTLGFGNMNPDMERFLAEEVKEYITMETQAMPTDSIPTTAVAQWEALDYTSVCVNGFRRNPYIRTAVNNVGQAISAIEIDLTFNGKPIENHDFLESLKRPNSNQSGSKFMKTIVRDLLLAGNCYVYVIKGAGVRPIFRILRPDRIIEISLDTWGDPISYKYSPNNDGKFIVIPANDMIHLMEDDPIDYKGRSIIQAVWESTCLNNDIRDLNKLWLDNGGQFPGVFSLKEPVTKNILDNLKNSVINKIAGKKNFGKMPVIPAQLEFTQLSQQMSDMFYEKMANMTAREIGIVLGIPPQVLGIPESNTYANYEQAQDFYAKYTLVPWINYICQVFTKQLQMIYGTEYELKPDLDTVIELAAERAKNEEVKRTSTIALYQGGIITLNEAREEFDLKAVGDGETFVKPVQKLN